MKADDTKYLDKYSLKKKERERERKKNTFISNKLVTSVIKMGVK